MVKAVIIAHLKLRRAQSLMSAILKMALIHCQKYLSLWRSKARIDSGSKSQHSKKCLTQSETRRSLSFESQIMSVLYDTALHASSEHKEMSGKQRTKLSPEPIFMMLNLGLGYWRNNIPTQAFVQSKSDYLNNFRNRIVRSAFQFMSRISKQLLRKCLPHACEQGRPHAI